MSKTESRVNRTTKETAIDLVLDLRKPGDIRLNTQIPFLNHMLHAMTFHGDFSLSIEAKGDINGGGDLIKLKTGGGNIHIRKLKEK